MNNKPFIHLFRTRNHNYVYDANTNGFVSIGNDTYEVLNKNINSSEYEDFNIENSSKDEKISNEINTILEQGFLSSNRPSEIIHPYTELLSSYLNNSLKVITLQVTQQCNLRCTYCTYSGDDFNRAHSHKEMDISIAKKGIDFLIKHSKNTASINVGFYGGEPLLRFDFIKKCIEYAKEKGEGKEVTFNMTTNAILLNEEMIEFFADNNVDLTISLDGPKEIHNKNRKFSNGYGTFDKVIEKLEMVRSKYPDYLQKYIRFNAVMDGKSDIGCVNDFFANYDMIKDLTAIISPVNDSYEQKSQFDITENNITKIKYEQFKLYLYKLNKLDLDHVSKLFIRGLAKIKESLHEDRHLEKISIEKIHPGGPCIPGVNKLFMNVDGTFYPCERINEDSESTKIGDIYNGFDIEKAEKILNVGKLTEDKCKNCWAFRHCYLCIAYCDTPDGISKDKRASRCPEVRSSVENMFKDYLALKELGCNFEDEYINSSYTELA